MKSKLIRVIVFSVFSTAGTNVQSGDWSHISTLCPHDTGGVCQRSCRVH